MNNGAVWILAAVLLLGAIQAEGKATVTTVEVTSFGAVPGDGKSDTAAVLEAIDKCRTSKPAVLAFKKGQYDFFEADGPLGRDCVFALDGLENVTIDGRGSTFMFHGYKGAFQFGRCKNVTMRDLTIDYIRPPFSFGRIVAVNGKSFDVEMDEKYPITGKEGVKAYMEFDPKAGHASLNPPDGYYTSTSTELVKPHVMRVNLNHDATIKPGAWVILSHCVYGPNALVAGGCTNFTLENVNIYTAPGMAFVAGRCTNVTVKGLKVIPRPGSGFPMSTTADGLHFGGNKGLITIEDCEFEGMGDDAANIKAGLYLGVTEKVDDRTVLAVHNLKIPDAPDPGDTIEIVRRANLLPYAAAVVESVEMQPEGVHKIRFKEPLPAGLEIGDLLGDVSRVAKVRIKNCSVRSNRARGFLIQNRDVVVEGCKFTNCTSGGVWVLTECFYFYESIGSRNVVVRNCTFENCGYWSGPCVLGAYSCTGPQSFSTVPGVHKNVLFEGNRIIGTDNSGIFIAGVDGITLRNNTVEQACRKPDYQHGSAAIYVMGSSKVTVQGNKAEPANQGAGCKTMFEIGPGCEKDAVKLLDNVGF